MALSTVDPIKLELGFDLVPLARPDLGGTLVGRIGRLREEILLRIGIKLPPIRLVDNFDIQVNQCVVYIKGIKVSQVSMDCVTITSIPSSEASFAAKLIAEHLREIFARYASDLLDYDQLKYLLEQTAVTYPMLVAEYDRMFHRKSGLLRILRNLVGAGSSIRNLPIILETQMEAGNELTSRELMSLIQARIAIRA